MEWSLKSLGFKILAQVFGVNILGIELKSRGFKSLKLRAHLSN